MICKTEGLVLRGYRMSQSSKVAVVFAREFGKLRLAARGARRPKSKFGASVEPITLGNYVFYRREGRDLQTLSEGDIVYPFSGIKRSYGRTAYASAICDLIDHMAADEDRNSMLFDVAVEALRWLESIEEGAMEVALWSFCLKAAAALGYRPHLSGCVRCGGRLSGARVQFHPAQGGTLCGRCAAGGISLGMPAVLFLEGLQTGRPDRIRTDAFEGPDRLRVRSALRGFLAYHVEDPRRMKSLEFLDRMQAAEGAPTPYAPRGCGGEVA